MVSNAEERVQQEIAYVTTFHSGNNGRIAFQEALLSCTRGALRITLPHYTLEITEFRAETCYGQKQLLPCASFCQGVAS